MGSLLAGSGNQISSNDHSNKHKIYIILMKLLHIDKCLIKHCDAIARISCGNIVLVRSLSSGHDFGVHLDQIAMACGQNRLNNTSVRLKCRKNCTTAYITSFLKLSTKLSHQISEVPSQRGIRWARSQRTNQIIECLCHCRHGENRVREKKNATLDLRRKF